LNEKPFLPGCRSLPCAQSNEAKKPFWSKPGLLRIVHAAKKRGDFINAFALGQLLWPTIRDEKQQNMLADTLAGSCHGLEVWERANNKP
jgi:hypothetical protein